MRGAFRSMNKPRNNRTRMRLRGEWNRRLARLMVGAIFGWLSVAATAWAGPETAAPSNDSWSLSSVVAGPEGVTAGIRVLITLAVLSLAPAIALMTTSYVRIVVVLGLLRQALGTQHLPSNQVLSSLALFLTLLVMFPIWQRVYDEALQPYQREEIDASEAWVRGVAPVRRFLVEQIRRMGNEEDLQLFTSHLAGDAAVPQDSSPQRATHQAGNLPLRALLPAFLLSELKTAFLIGFQVLIPFVVVDLVVATVLTAMGLVMLPPATVSLPFKLLLFVMVDGWHLVVEMLLVSFQLA